MKLFSLEISPKMKFYSLFQGCILVFALVCHCSLALCAENSPISEELKNLSNEEIMAIYEEILSSRSRYKELENFDESALTLNPHGIYSIDYSYTYYEPNNPALNNQIVEFGVTIVPMGQQKDFVPNQRNFSVNFPILNLRLLGYQSKSIKDKELNLHHIVRNHGKRMFKAQQKRMPLQLKLESLRPEFHVGESIEFKVTLKNNTSKNVMIKKLSEKSLAFEFDKKQPDANQSIPAYKSEKNYILKQHDSVSKKFLADPVNTPKEIEISAYYGLTFKGVQPSDSIKIRVVK